MPAGHLGRIKSKEDERTIKFGDFLGGLKKAGLLPKLPEGAFGHGNDFQGESWAMLGNGPPSAGEPEIKPEWAAAKEGAGDCFWAGQAHALMAAAFNAGTKVPRFNAESVLSSGYIPYTKEAFGKPYNPKTGANDEGTEPLSGLKRMQKIGMADADGAVHKIGTYLALDPKDPEQLYYGLWLLEGVGIGFECPDTAMSQFNEGKVWKPVEGWNIEGGHWVYGVGTPLAPSKRYYTLITWARRQLALFSFYEKTNDETWGIIYPESFKSTTGKDWEGHDEATTEEYLTIMAKKKAALLS